MAHATQADRQQVFAEVRICGSVVRSMFKAITQCSNAKKLSCALSHLGRNTVQLVGLWQGHSTSHIKAITQMTASEDSCCAWVDIATN